MLCSTRTHVTLIKTGVAAMTVVCFLCGTFLHTNSTYPLDDDTPIVPPRRLPQRKLSNILDFRKLKHIHLHDLHQDLGDQKHFDCVKSGTRPSFPICVYEEWQDVYISGALRSDGIWEPYITQVFQEALRQYPETTIIDIGANIGYYTHLAAAMHHSAIAIEPQWNNILRFHHGANLGGNLERVQLLHNAVSDVHTNVTLTVNYNNQGGIRVQPMPNQEQDYDGQIIHTITLNDLLQLADFSQAIIKVDIEGYECRAMGKSALFLDKIYVPYIFMEWKQMFVMRDKPSTACPSDRLITLSEYLTNRGYIPHEVRTGFQLNPIHAAGRWKIGDLYWRHKTAKKLQPDY